MKLFKGKKEIRGEVRKEVGPCRAKPRLWLQGLEGSEWEGADPRDCV